MTGTELKGSGSLREFVGLAWEDDWHDQTGIIVEVQDVASAVAIVHEALPGWRVSLWNEEDAARAR